MKLKMKMEEERLTPATDVKRSKISRDSKDLKALFWHQHHEEYWGSVCHNMGPLNE